MTSLSLGLKRRGSTRLSPGRIAPAAAFFITAVTAALGATPIESPAAAAVTTAAVNPIVGAHYAMATLPAGSARRHNANFASKIPAGKPSSVREAYKVARTTLSELGYTEMGWFPMVRESSKVGLVSAEGISEGQLFGVGGFTKIEQYGSDGRPRAEAIRWSSELPTNGIASIEDFLVLLLQGAQPGLYRTFFVALTEDVPPKREIAPAEMGTFDRMRIAGLQDLSHSWDRFDETAQPGLMVVVYEFEKSAADGRVTFFQQSGKGIDFHLRGSGLTTLFDP